MSLLSRVGLREPSAPSPRTQAFISWGKAIWSGVGLIPGVGTVTGIVSTAGELKEALEDTEHARDYGGGRYEMAMQRNVQPHVREDLASLDPAEREAYVSGLQRYAEGDHTVSEDPGPGEWRAHQYCTDLSAEHDSARAYLEAARDEAQVQVVAAGAARPGGARPGEAQVAGVEPDGAQPEGGTEGQTEPETDEASAAKDAFQPAELETPSATTPGQRAEPEAVSEEPDSIRNPDLAPEPQPQDDAGPAPTPRPAAGPEQDPAPEPAGNSGPLPTPERDPQPSRDPEFEPEL